jgi:hypothetical protein
MRKQKQSLQSCSMVVCTFFYISHCCLHRLPGTHVKLLFLTLHALSHFIQLDARQVSLELPALDCQWAFESNFSALLVKGKSRFAALALRGSLD